MTDSYSDPEVSESLSRSEAEEFIRIAKKIFDAMGEPTKAAQAVIMEPTYNDTRKVCQIHFIHFLEPEVSRTEKEVPDRGE